jgi:SAM-dependent methyltransferase
MDMDRLAARYTGARAQQYSDRRTQEPKWQAEQRIVEHLLRTLPSGATLVDIPVGTGRFLPLYERLGIAAIGMDVSPDMLAQARTQSSSARLRLSDIRRIEAADGEYDCALCVRFLNWIDASAFRAAVKELVRVSRGHVILGVRFYPVAGVRGTRRLRQLWTRWRGPTQGPIVVHEEAAVQGTFREAGLTIRAAECVEQASDGTDYYIYDLTRE